MKNQNDFENKKKIMKIKGRFDENDSTLKTNMIL